MHPDTHLRLHHQRAAELHAQAAEDARVRHPESGSTLRTRLGWTMVELGLRLAQHPPARSARIA
ncbi:hypothetical protein GCM10009730_39100 [Streptomyces albidochromogenes]|uniref:hypothetical protein n=1 Tax=Streptomyces albidochromogenes TaxID=329524 RepID=UPI00110F7117|nr:hypothetical protein [Streptomyces albidochromogenes]